MGAGPTRLNFPGFGFKAAEYVFDTRKGVGIGIDTISLDTGKKGSSDDLMVQDVH